MDDVLRKHMVRQRRFLRLSRWSYAPYRIVMQKMLPKKSRKLLSLQAEHSVFEAVKRKRKQEDGKYDDFLGLKEAKKGTCVAEILEEIRKS